MPTTGDTWIALETGQVLDFATLDTNLVGLTREALARVRADIFGTDATIGNAAATFTYASSTLDLDATRYGVTPDGYRIKADAADAAWQNIPFKDTAAVLFHVGARRQLRPASVTGNTADGGYYYDTEIEDVGELGQPDAVTDQGGGAGLFIDVDADPTGIVREGWTVGQTRRVVVYLVNPVTASADAIYSGTIAWNAGAGTHRITVPHYFGQGASPSLDPADYRVLIQGPTISVAPLSGSTYWELGACTTGVPSTSGQNVMPTWGSWLTWFAAEHDTTTGKHKAINGDSFTYNTGSASRSGEILHDAHQLQGFNGTARQNGGAIQNMGFVAAGGGQPAYVQTLTPVSGTWAEVYVPIRMSGDQAWELSSLNARIWLATAGAGEYLQIDLVEKDPTMSSWNTLASWTMAKPAAATWGNVVPASGPGFPFSVLAPGAQKRRFWRLVFGEPNPGYCRVAGLWGGAKATKLPPIPW